MDNSCPGDPLFIQVDRFETARSQMEGTLFSRWIQWARVVYLIDRHGRVKCMKDRDGTHRWARWTKETMFVNDLFESIEEMLTHEQAPIRKWGLFYKQRGCMFDNSRKRRRERRREQRRRHQMR